MAHFQRAVRKRSKLRIGVLGPAGGGKTWGALKLAGGLAPWEKIFLIDSERGSASLYSHLGAFNVAELDGDFNPQRYVESIKDAEAEGAEVIIVDSLSHAWSGTGGTLDLKAAKEAKSGNGWTAWRDVTPLHNALVDAMLQSKAHIIATMRVKMEYVQEKDPNTGKTVIRKVGLQPVQRDSMEYEFGLVLDVDSDHWATSTKDRTSLFDGKRFQISEDTGNKLKDWLEGGADLPDPAPRPAPVTEVIQTDVQKGTALLLMAQTLDELKMAWTQISPATQKALATFKDARKAAIESKEVK